MHSLTFTLFRYILVLIVCFFALGASFAHGADQPVYQPLIAIPGLTNDSTRTLAGFFNTAYMVLIGLGALFAVLKISLAGVKYSLSDLISSKSEAKNDIYGSLLGLAILLIPFMVLNTINPNLTNINVLDGALKVTLTESTDVPVAATLGNGANASPAERDALIKSCPNDLRTPAPDSFCCANAEYTGTFKCGSTVASAIDTRIGLDTAKVYKPGEINDLLKSRPQGTVNVIGVTTRPDQAAADCTGALAGSTPIIFTQAGNSTTGAKKFDKVLVCAK